MKPTLLKGIRLVDLSMGWAGPLAGRHFADMGAEVIKVESCQHVDWWRGWEATQAWIDDHGAEKAVSFNTMNRHKKDVTLDLNTDRGRDLCKQLVAVSDAVIANYSGSVLGKLGLDYDDLRQVKPDIVMMSMPAFGSTGPWKNYRAYGSTIEQASGLPHINGEADWPPTMQHVALGDPIAGLNAAAALLIALRHRHRTGEGQYLDLSQSECLFPLGVHGILSQAATGAPPARMGNRSATQCPHGVYPCIDPDSWITIQVDSEDAWLSLKALAAPLLDEFGDLEARIERRAALDARLGQWTGQFEATGLMERLQGEGILAAAVLGAGEVAMSPHLAARQCFPLLSRAYVGELPHPVSAWREGGVPYDIDAPSPTLGEHNTEILTSLLGLSDEELADLAEQQVIGTRPVLQE
ncbi:MAG: CaiB/BaiF CoA transferase family protein [Pseudomonadota bacterium]